MLLIGNTNESVLQKFRKSFALKFHKKLGSKEGVDTGQGRDGDLDANDGNTQEIDNDVPVQHLDHSEATKEECSGDPKFRYNITYNYSISTLNIALSNLTDCNHL